MQNLASNMTTAWQQRAQAAIDTLLHITNGPALFKPDALEQARRDYAHAVRETGRWSA